jgi:hypothetical protein
MHVLLAGLVLDLLEPPLDLRELVSAEQPGLAETPRVDARRLDIVGEKLGVLGA